MFQIAIVDDNEAWCFVLAQRLKMRGYEVSSFTEAPQFLQEASRFDLALIDFLIPARRHQTEMDGVELIRQIKQRLEHPPILVLISSFFSDDILHQVPELCPEANLCMSKTLELRELLGQVDQLLATRKPLHSCHQLRSTVKSQTI